MNSAIWGTFEACLSNPTLPAMRAGAAKRLACQSRGASQATLNGANGG